MTECYIHPNLKRRRIQSCRAETRLSQCLVVIHVSWSITMWLGFMVNCLQLVGLEYFRSEWRV